MPLHYDLRDVKADWKSDAIWPVTNTLIHATMIVEMGSINKHNWETFYSRCHMIETIYGAWLMQAKDEGEGLKPRPITPKDIRDHIGLGTNASTVSDAKFKSHIFKRFNQQAKDLIKADMHPKEWANA